MKADRSVLDKGRTCPSCNTPPTEPTQLYRVPSGQAVSRLSCECRALTLADRLADLAREIDSVGDRTQALLDAWREDVTTWRSEAFYRIAEEESDAFYRAHGPVIKVEPNRGAA